MEIDDVKKFLEGTKHEQWSPDDGPKQDIDPQNEENFFYTAKGVDSEAVLEMWNEEYAINVAKEQINELGEPDVVEKDQLTWFDVSDPVNERQWDMFAVRDMADTHLNHVDAVFASKHTDYPPEAREDIHLTEGVVSTSGTHVLIVCGDWSGINSIYDKVLEQIEGHLGNDT